MCRYSFLIGLIFMGMLLGLNTDVNSQSSANPSSVSLPIDAQATIAVMPFFSGKWQPGATEKADQTLACTLAQICRTDPNIRADADRVITTLSYDWLATRLGDRLISFERTASAFADLKIDSELATPQSLAKTLGARLGADLVVAGTVWRYRERGAIEGIPDSPAAVAFAIYLIDAKTGQRKWRGVVDVVQNKITDDLFQARQQGRLGIGWLSADELAKLGVDQVFENFPL